MCGGAVVTTVLGACLVVAAVGGRLRVSVNVGTNGTHNSNSTGRKEDSNISGLPLSLLEELTKDESVLRRFLRAAGSQPLSINGTENTRRSEQVAWRCLMAWVRARNHDSQDNQNRRSQPGCQNHTEMERDLHLEQCAPLLLVLVPSFCNGMKSCANLTQVPLEELMHRYWAWQRRKKRNAEADDAVIYIVVVLAFYSFGIVFMMANFVRQEQRELEETKMYKQYVKLARDRWLTTRGNPANKLALQALNTFNAVPQTTDANKVTFV